MSLFFELNEANRALREKETIINDVIIDKDIDNTRKNLISEAANSIYDTPALHIDESVTDDASDFPSLSKAILKDGTRVLGSGLAYDTKYSKLSRYRRSELNSMGVTWVNPEDRTNFGICKDLRFYGYKHHALLPRAYKMNYSTIPYEDIVYGMNLYIAISGNSICYSEDCKEWKRSNLVDTAINSISFGNNTFVAATAIGVYYSSNGMDWVISSITDPSTNVGYNFNKFVATTNSGIYYSADGITWTISNVTSGSFDQLLFANSNWFVTDIANNKLRKTSNGVTWVDCTINQVGTMDIQFANSIYVAATNYGLYYSTNGTSWTVSNISSGSCDCVLYFNDTWVADNVDVNGILYSTDGKTWTNSDFITGNFNSFITFEDKIIACSSSNTGIIYSSNGKIWNYSNLMTGSFCGIVKVNNTLVAASTSDGGIYYSTDGETWRNTNISSGSFTSLQGFDNLCLVKSATGIYYIDMTRKILGYKRNSNEEVVNLTSYLMKVCDIAENNIDHVEIQSNGFYYIAYIYNTSSTFKVYLSTDLITWAYFGDKNLYVNGIGNIFSIATDGMSVTMYLNPLDASKTKTINLALSSQSIYRTTEMNPLFGYKDMMTFISTYGNMNQLGDENAKSNRLDAVEIPRMVSGTIKVTSDLLKIDNLGFIPEKAFLTFRGDDEFNVSSGEIIVSRNTEVPTIMRAANGAEWTASELTASPNYVYFNNNLFVLASTGGIYYSEDGKTWTQSNITEVDFRSIYYANNLWIAGSTSGIYYSEDGKTWTQSDLTSGTIVSICYADSMWVAAARSNKGIYYSLDGKTWSQTDRTTEYFNNIIWKDNVWVATGWNNNGLYYSINGINWVKSNVTSGDFDNISIGDDLIVACGTLGIYYSTDGKSWTSAFGSKTYDVEYNEDDNTWVAGTVNGLYYSEDGKTWMQSNITTDGFYDVCYTHTVWLAGNNSGGNLYYSNDNGVTWTVSSVNNATFSYHSLCYGNHIAVAMAQIDDTTVTTGFYSELNKAIDVNAKSIVTPLTEVFAESTVGTSTVYESNDLTNYIVNLDANHKNTENLINNAYIDGNCIQLAMNADYIGSYIDYTIIGRNISAEDTADEELLAGAIEVEPTVIAKLNTGVNQKLISPGEGTGAMLYSLDGINYSLNIPEASDSGDYMVYYYSSKNATYRRSTIGQISVHLETPLRWILAAGLGKGILYSGDGKEWFQSNLKNTYVDDILQMNDYSLVAVTSDGLYYSDKNGAEWNQCVVLVNGEPILATASNVNFSSIVSNKNVIVVGGANNNGLYYGGASAKPDGSSSANGKYFTASNITTGTFDFICCVRDIWFAAGEGHLYYSTDGIVWNTSNLPTSYVYSISASTGNTFVVSCSTGLYYSMDSGATWTQSNISTNNFGDIAYGNNYFVALTTDSTGVYYSKDGKSWAQSELTSGRFSTVYYNGVWILGSDDNTGLYYSTDCKTWVQSNITTGYIHEIVNFGFFIAISSEGILYSADGQTWSTTNITKDNIQSVSGTESDNLYIASTNDNSGIYYSADGQSWTLSDMKSNNFSGTIFVDRNDI